MIQSDVLHPNHIPLKVKDQAKIDDHIVTPHSGRSDYWETLHPPELTII